MKEYRLNEETWKLMMIALNKAPYDLVIPVINKIKTEVKLVTINSEQISEQKEESSTKA